MTQQEKFAAAADAISSCRDEVKVLIEGEGHASITVNTGLTVLVDRMNFLAGRKQGIGNVAHASTQLQPITEFMGDDIKKAPAVRQEELSPEEERRQQFLAKVEKTEETLKDRDNKDILESLVTDEDKLVIRAVAKRAGVEDYKDAEINDDFLDFVRKAMDDQEEGKEHVKQTEVQIAGAQADFKEADEDEDPSK